MKGTTDSAAAIMAAAQAHQAQRRISLIKMSDVDAEE